jgi:L-threonylcarbamoyladenylate synthase
MIMDNDDVAASLNEGGVGVFPTDTLYGLIGSALNPDAVDRIYDLKRRDPRKPLIVLINDIATLETFGVELTAALEERLRTYWPGPYSIVLPVIDDQFEYLSRGHDAIAFRLPDNDQIVDLIDRAGPLVAPSANPEGRPPATTIEEARKYFGSDAEFYIDDGVLEGPPSTLITFDGDDVETLRG